MTLQQHHFLFFAERIEGSTLFLSSEELRHLHSVLRIREGGAFQATDGAGMRYSCALLDTDRTGARARILEAVAPPPITPEVTLYVGIPERDCFEWLLEAVVPLGVQRIVPMICELCQKPWWDQKWDKQLERSERKAIAGIKQAQLTMLPKLAPPLGFEQSLSESLLLQPIVALEEGRPAGECIDTLRQSNRIACLVGPPGGFSPRELDLFNQHTVLSCRLGASRLRTELAATLLCAVALQSGL